MKKLDADSLLEVLAAYSSLDDTSRFVIAFSGGVDTAVLMHLLYRASKRFEFPLLALHVDHNINPRSGEWARQCADFCQTRGIPCHSTRLDQFNPHNRVPENEARIARYDWLKKQVSERDILLTGHHKNDQAETLMLNLMRGAGARGLAGIQEFRHFGKGMLVRPMLRFTKEQILEYAANHDLDYIDDPANDDLHYDRNYLRHLVLPKLAERWESAIENINQSAKFLADARSMLDDLAEIDIAACRTIGTAFLSIGYQLNMEEFRKLSRARQINLIRHWIRTHSLPEPGRKSLDNFLETTVDGTADYAEMDWEGYKLCLFQKRLYLVLNIVQNELESIKVFWNLQQPLVLESAGIRLIPNPVVGKGISVDRLPESVSVCFRKGGESFRMSGQSHSSKLKKLLQAHSIPPWERSTLPLIYSHDELIAVAPWRVSNDFAASKEQDGIEIEVELISRSGD